MIPFSLFASELLDNFQEIILSTIWTMMLPAGSNIQPHTGVMPVSKSWFA